MSLTFADLKAKLAGSLDILPPAMLGDIINEALSDIYKSNEWGFLRKKDIVRTPNVISAGTIGVTKFSETVILDSIASAEITALDENSVPLIERQLKIVSTSENIGNPYSYNIIDFDTSNPSAIILTLDQPFWDESKTNAQYQILKMYYHPPFITDTNGDQVIDFKYWKFFISLKLRRKLWTSTTLEELNNFDPARNYTDDPRHVVAHPPNDDASFPLFELYPAPKFERVYQVIYQRKGLSLVKESDVIPQSLDANLIRVRAEYCAYKWALANIHKKAELKGSSGRFQNLMGLTMNPNDEAAYPKLLARMKKEDEENYPKAYLGDYMRLPYVDSFIGNFTYSNEFEGDGYSFPNTVALIDF
jgi:hypothetical protein